MMAWLSRSVKSPSTDKQDQHQRKINAIEGRVRDPTHDWKFRIFVHTQELFGSILAFHNIDTLLVQQDNMRVVPPGLVSP